MDRPLTFNRTKHKGLTFRSLRDSLRYDEAWRKFSINFLKRNPICTCDQVRYWDGQGYEVAALGPPDAVAAAKHVDHVRPLNQGGNKFDGSNLQSLCHSCHSKKTAKWG
ncbi:MAG: hypothetical protein JWO82_753 [Akkermansiaceae bacterium]|nr:hypothetical protein [Akkermansiaceae bacterium]